MFHNGDTFKIEDGDFSIERLRHPQMRLFHVQHRQGRGDGPKGVTITLVEPNSSTVRTLMGAAHGATRLTAKA